MPPRIAVGGMFHETNTFVSTTTGFEAFGGEWTEGGDLLDRHTGTGTELGGVIEGCRARGWGVEPLAFALATPSGMVTVDAYRAISDRLVDLLEQALGRVAPVDAVVLVLHGAMVVEGSDDPEGDLLARLRGLTPGLPIVCTMDFHANVSDAMVAAADCLISYDTYPHVDARERGLEAAGVVERLLQGQRAAARVVRPPLVPVPQVQLTTRPLLQALIEKAHDLEEDPDVLNVSVCGGFAYADVPFAGMSFTVTTASDPGKSEDAARELAGQAWLGREALRGCALPVADAVAQACRLAKGPGEGPVILVDSADNIGGGTPGDGTAILAELLSQRAGEALVVIRDPEAVASCWSAGCGAELELVVGGKTDSLHGSPVPMKARVESLARGRFVHRGPYMRGRRADMGRTAVVSSGGVRVVLTENRQPPWDAEMLYCLGIEPRTLGILAVKAAVAWRAAFGDICRAALEVDGPGATTVNLARLPYRKVRRPIFPLDESPEEWP